MQLYNRTFVVSTAKSFPFMPNGAGLCLLCKMEILMKDREMKVIRNCEFGQRRIIHCSFLTKLSDLEQWFFYTGMVQEDLSLKLFYNIPVHMLSNLKKVSPPLHWQKEWKTHCPTGQQKSLVHLEKWVIIYFNGKTPKVTYSKAHSKKSVFPGKNHISKEDRFEYASLIFMFLSIQILFQRIKNTVSSG